jgi:hypothetical protein
MRKFDQLSEKEKQQAINQALESIVDSILQGAMRFDDSLNQDDLQERIDRAFEKAEENQTPWFAAEILLEDAYVKESLEGMALCDAEDSLYLEDSESMPVRLRGVS